MKLKPETRKKIVKLLDKTEICIRKQKKKERRKARHKKLASFIKRIAAKIQKLVNIALFVYVVYKKWSNKRNHEE